MHTKYFLLTVFCYWASLSSYLPSTTAHTVIKAPADEDNFDQNQEGSLPKSLESLISVENGELSTEVMLQELLAGFSDNNFAAVSKKSDSEKKSTKPAAAGSKGKKKGKGNKKKPQPVVIEESEDTEDEDDDDEEESDEKEDTIVVGKPEDKTDETPEPEKPVGDNDGEILQVGARIGEEFHHYEIQTCTMVEVPLHENGIELTLNPISNTKKIMLTINQLARCSQILESVCPAGARFCHVQDLSEDSILKVGEEACHHNVAYLYLVPEKAAEPLVFELKVSITNEVQCKFAEQQQQGTSVNVDQYCQGLNAEQCQENAGDACTSKCMWVSCKVNNQDQQSLSSAYCAPANTPKDSLQQTCSKTEDFASAAPENQVIEYPVCAATNTDESVQQSETVEQSESGFHVDILKILSITFAVSLALCLVFSCYYRYQFRHNKRELCSPPEWCPNFLFPRNSNQMERFMTSGNRNLDQEMSSDYQPPVL